MLDQTYISLSVQARKYVYSNYKVDETINSKELKERMGLSTLNPASVALAVMRRAGVLEPIGKLKKGLISYKVVDLKPIEGMKDSSARSHSGYPGKGEGRHCKKQVLPRLEDGVSLVENTRKAAFAKASKEPVSVVNGDLSTTESLLELALEAEQTGLTRKLCIELMEIAGEGLAQLRRGRK